MDEVIVSRQQGQVMADTELRKHSIDGPDLNACPTAQVAQLRGIDMVLPVRAEQRQSGKSFDDGLSLVIQEMYFGRMTVQKCAM